MAVKIGVLFLLGIQLVCMLGCGAASSGDPQGAGLGSDYSRGHWVTYGRYGDDTGYIVFTDLTVQDPDVLRPEYASAQGREVKSFIARASAGHQIMVLDAKMFGVGEGELSINGHAYDLAHGRIFLAYVDQGKTHVRQLSVSPPSGRNIEKDLDDFVVNHNVIESFCRNGRWD